MGYSLHDALTEQADTVALREQEVACDEPLALLTRCRREVEVFCSGCGEAYVLVVSGEGRAVAPTCNCGQRTVAR